MDKVTQEFLFDFFISTLNKEFLEYSISKGFDVNFIRNYYSLLMYASRYGHTETVKILIEKGAEIDLKNIHGNTALMCASRNDHTETVKILIEKGAEVDLKNIYENTALMFASIRGHTETVKILLEKGAKVDLKNTCGSTALIWASMNGHTETVKILEKKEKELEDEVSVKELLKAISKLLEKMN